MPGKVTIDFQALTSVLLGALLVAFVTGGISAYVRLAELTVAVDNLTVEVSRLRQAAHTHPVGKVPTFLPDAIPED